MKKFIYRLLIKSGYKIENKHKEKSGILMMLRQFESRANPELLFRANGYITRIKSVYTDLEIIDKGNGVIVSFAGFRIYVESAEEFFIISEVFIEKDYNFISDEQSILIDVGANIGVASLFFSKLPSVKKIYAFEPVKDTFDQAVLNISMNNLQEKIMIQNIGLGRNSREETFIFNKFIKGNTGLRGKLSKSYAGASDYENRKVAIKDVSEIFQTIIIENPSNKIVVKLDCEGAEYEIIERLKATGVLEKTHVFLIEWHDKGAETIEKQLQEAGFIIFSRQLTENSGMLYAVNRKSA